MGVNCLIFAGNTEYPFKMITAGPYRIATELRSNGFTTQVVDLAYEKTFTKLHEAVLKKFVDKDTLWVGFSVNFMRHILGYPFVNSEAELNYYRTYEPTFDQELKKFVEYVKTLNSNTQLVIGGVRIFSCGYLGFTEFRGYTDQQIVQYTKELSRKTIPLYDLIKNDEFSSFTSSKITYLKQDILGIHKALPVEVSRGCIFNCKFCSYALRGKSKGEWVKNLETLKEELTYNYQNYGVEDYILTDDTYNDSIDKMLSLKKYVYDTLPFKINFVSYVRTDLVYRFPHTAEILQESGLVEANLGLETTNKSAAKIIGKGTDPNLLIDFIAKLKTKEWKNITVFSSWILGLPGDTKQSIIDFLKWINSNDNPVNNSRISPLQLNPPKTNIFALYRSAFDVDYQKYLNVEFYEGSKGRIFWRSLDTDLDEEWLFKIHRIQGDILDESNRKSYRTNRINDRVAGRFLYPSLVSLGIPKEDIFNLPAYDFKRKHDVKNLAKIQNFNYIKNLLEL